MPALTDQLDWLQPRLAELLAEHDVPGASVAVACGDELVTATSGVTNLTTGVEVTPEAVFLIGSVSKVFTATLVFQLVDRGEVDLDAPVRTYLPELRLADDKAASTITVRQLLTHTSGIEGDHLDDFGRGDEAVARYVESLADIGTIHEPGRMFSYCNSGFVVAGRLVEVLADAPYRQVVRERLLTPLGLEQAATLPEEAILHRAAAGHVQGKDGVVLTTSWMLPYALAPAGSILCMSAADLVAFGRLHLGDGRDAAGDEVLSADALKTMQQPQVDMRTAAGGSFMCHGWALSRRQDERLLWHTGGTTGQFSQLALLPDHGVAVGALTNGPKGALVHRAIVDEVGHALVGLQPAAEPIAADPVPELDLSRYVGVYQRLGMRQEVSLVEGTLHLEISSSYESATGGTGASVKLRPVDHQFFVVEGPSGDTGATLAFLDFETSGEPRYLYTGRVARRI